MRRILVAIDGSVGSMEALEYVTQRKRNREAIEVFVVNVQPCIRPHPQASANANIEDYQWHEGEKILGSPVVKAHRALLDAEAFLVVGDAAEQIVALAEDLNCDEIVLGDGNQARRSSLLLGSVRLRVIELSTIPVVIVKSRDPRTLDMAA